MPLPDGGNIPWPPKEVEPILYQYSTWAAWYSGDIARISAVYGGDDTGGGRDTYGFFASERGGFRGVIGAAARTVRRWFWGSRRISPTNRQRLHVPIAGDIASASADLLFSEPPTVTASDQATQERLTELLDDGTHAVLLEAAEICAALGGVYLRVVWDPATRPDRPWITAVHPDVAIPEWRWGNLSAVTFWREIHRKGRLVVRHLERHEPGLVLHGVYEGDAQTLGRVVPLTDYPETAGLANEQLVNGNEVHTGVTTLTAVYVPNMKPNRTWRCDPNAVHLGRSDYAGVEPLMDALDMTYSSWMRDVDLGKARLIVPQEYMRSNGPGQGAVVDLDQEIYEGVHAMSSDTGGIEIKEVQFAIRVAEHQATITDLKTSIVTSAGYSVQTFGLAGEVAATATEVAARERRSLITRNRKARYWRTALAEVLETLLGVDKALFGTRIAPQLPQVEWTSGVSVDPLQQAQTLQALATAEAISTWQKVKTLHPDWDDQEVQAEVDRIRDDGGSNVENPDTFTGAPADDKGQGEEDDDMTE